MGTYSTNTQITLMCIDDVTDCEIASTILRHRYLRRQKKQTRAGERFIIVTVIIIVAVTVTATATITLEDSATATFTAIDTFFISHCLSSLICLRPQSQTQGVVKHFIVV